MRHLPAKPTARGAKGEDGELMESGARIVSVAVTPLQSSEGLPLASQKVRLGLD